jgi:hypothetical protein
LSYDIAYPVVDAAGFKEEIERYAVANFSNIWNVFSDGEPATIWRDLLSLFYEVYYEQINFRIKNKITSTLKIAAEGRRLAKMFGYEARTVQSSLVTLQFTVTASSVPVTIPKGFKVSAVNSTYEETVYFSTLEDLIIVGGNPATGTVQAAEGVSSYTEQTGTGEVGQKVQIPYVNVTVPTDSSLFLQMFNVYIDGVRWERGTHQVDFSSTDKKYWITWDDDGNLYVNFGDGTHGLIPAVNTTIRIEYWLSTGILGNGFAASTITNLADSLSGVTAVTNTTATAGGEDEADVLDIDRNLPKFNRTHDAISSLQSCADYALTNVAGVGRTSCIAGTTVLEYILYTVPSGVTLEWNHSSQTLSQTLRSAIEGACEDKMQPSTILTIYEPYYFKVYVAVTIQVNSGYRQSLAKEKVRAIFEHYFSYQMVDFNKTISMQDLRSAILDLDEIASVEFRVFSRKPRWKANLNNSVFSPLIDSTNPSKFVGQTDGPEDEITISVDAKKGRWVVQKATTTQYRVYKRNFGVISGLTNYSTVKSVLLDESLNLQVDEGIYDLADDAITSSPSITLQDTEKYWPTNKWAAETIDTVTYYKYALIDSNNNCFPITSNTHDTLTCATGVNYDDLSSESTIDLSDGDTYKIVKCYIGDYVNPDVKRSAANRVQVIANTENSFIFDYSDEVTKRGTVGNDYYYEKSVPNTDSLYIADGDCPKIFQDALYNEIRFEWPLFTANSQSDEWWFEVDDYAGGVIIGDDEFPIYLSSGEDSFTDDNYFDINVYGGT